MSDVSIINKDDKHWEDFTNLSKKDLFYGIKSNGLDVSLSNFKGRIKILGDYNRYNVLAAVAVARGLDIEEKIIEKAVEKFKLPVGRMERINEGQNFLTFVDFAHTPNGFECALSAARQWTQKRLIVVFGCAGLRDKTKRPMMGEIASRIADKVIVTAEDPRTENLDEINRQITAGMKKKNWQVIRDRKKAIFQAIKTAQKGDLVIITGKGHEKSMCLGTTEIPWSDQNTVKKALKELF